MNLSTKLEIIATKKALAYLISRIFGPISLICFLWLVTAIKSGIGFWKALWIYPLIFVVSIAVPVSITSYLIVIKKVSSIEWPNIPERKRYLTPVTLSGLATLVLLSYLLLSSTLFHLSLALATILLIAIFIFTFFNFKISLHMIIASICFAGINLFFHQKLMWLFLLLIPIAWARHILKIHTWNELIAGIILANGIILLALFLFGWPAIP